MARLLSSLRTQWGPFAGDAFPGHLLPVQGVDSSALEAVATSFYSGTCIVSASTVCAIYDAASKLEAQSLSGACSTFVLSNLSADNCCIILNGALQFKQ